MPDTVIKVENLSKRYRLGERQAGYKTIRESITNAGFSLLRRLSSNEKIKQKRQTPYDNTTWALKKVSFEVQRGEVMGIIGRNGAGKSTLLKILSKITEPTTGRAVMHGRIGSLLEVGTGFHPELTGHENIYMYGAILGMDRWEVSRKFDQIVGFAELDRFMNTPVKRYSSGMYMRLAFAVAAYLEPEILLIDEVLAVGDAAFQKKCLGKMGDVAKEGRTVLFVSHNMAAVENLCDRALLLNKGRCEKDGEAKEVIQTYLSKIDSDLSFSHFQIEARLQQEQQQKNIDFIFKSIALFDLQQNPIKEIGTGDGLIIRLGFQAKRKFVAPAFMIAISNHYGVELIRLSTMPISGYFIESIEGSGAVELMIPALPLTGGKYSLTIGFARANVEWIVRLENIMTISVNPKDVYQSGLLMDNTRGLITLEHHWNLQSDNHRTKIGDTNRKPGNTPL